MRSRSSSSTTLATSAGASALTTKVAMSCDHGIHARPAHADAGADRIDRGIPRDNRDLGAGAGIARYRFDFHDAVVDFRHFLREQFRHELRMGAGQENLRPALLAANVVDVGANAI